MAGWKLQDDLRVHVRILRVADHLRRDLRRALAPFELTEPQFNVLRILRGAGSRGLPCKEVGARMVQPVPDITRLMDRLEACDLLTRRRDDQDRRVVMARITPEGRRLLRRIDPVLERRQERPLAPLSVRERRRLGELLERIEIGDDGAD